MALHIIDDSLERQWKARHHLYAIVVGTTSEDPGARTSTGKQMPKGVPILKDAFFVHEKHPSIKVDLGGKISSRRALAEDFGAWNGHVLAAVREGAGYKYIEPPPGWTPADGYKLEPALGKKTFHALIHFPKFEDAAEMRRCAMKPDTVYKELYPKTGGKPPGYTPPPNNAPFCESWDGKTAQRWHHQEKTRGPVVCAGKSCPFAMAGDCKYQTGIEYTLNEPGFPKVGCFTHTGSYYGAVDLRDFQKQQEEAWDVELRQRSIPNPPPMNWANVPVIFSVHTRHRMSQKRGQWEQYPVIELALDGIMSEIIDRQLTKAEETQARIRNLITGSQMPALEAPRSQIRALLAEDTSILMPQPEIIRPRPEILDHTPEPPPAPAPPPPPTPEPAREELATSKLEIELDHGTPTDREGRPTCQKCNTSMRPVRNRADNSPRWKCEKCGARRLWNGTPEN